MKMKRSIFTVIMILGIFIFCNIMNPVEAKAAVASGYCGGEGDGTNLTWKFDSETSTLTISGSGMMAEYSGNAPWSEYRTTMKNLVIENGVTVIGPGAFYECSGFTGDLIIPDSVTYIGEHAFYFCSGFTGDLVIPKNVMYIGSHAFDGCTGFTGNLKIFENVTYIGDGAFQECRGFTGGLVIPEDTTYIGSRAFADCTGFDRLILSNNVDEICMSAFENCMGFSGKVILPESLETIGSAAFAGCTGIDTIAFSGKAPEIEEYAFAATTFTCYYPENDNTWTNDKMQDYGGNITWMLAKKYPTGIELSATTMELLVGETGKLEATLIPEEVIYSNVVWTSSNKSVATVVNGVITAKEKGSATICAATEDGEQSVYCEVTVLEDVSADAPVVTVAPAKSYPGKTIDVDIMLENNPGIVSMILEVGYDHDVLTLESVIDAGILGEAVHSDDISADVYQLTWENGAAEENYTQNGKLVTLRFNVAEDAEFGEYDIKLTFKEALNYGIENVRVYAVDGTVVIKELIFGDVCCDEEINLKDAMYLQRYVAKWEGYEELIDMDASDLNNDGEVNMLDIIILQRHIAKWTGYDTLPYVKE